MVNKDYQYLKWSTKWFILEWEVQRNFALWTHTEVKCLKITSTFNTLRITIVLLHFSALAPIAQKTHFVKWLKMQVHLYYLLAGVPGVARVSKVRKHCNLIPPRNSMCLRHLFPLPPRCLPPHLLLPVASFSITPSPSLPPYYPPPCIPLPVALLPISPPPPPSCPPSPPPTPLPTPLPALAFWSLPAPKEIKRKKYLHLNQDILQLLLSFCSFTHLRWRLRPTALSPHSSSGDFTSILQISTH